MTQVYKFDKIPEDVCIPSNPQSSTISLLKLNVYTISDIAWKYLWEHTFLKCVSNIPAYPAPAAATTALSSELLIKFTLQALLTEKIRTNYSFYCH